MNGKSFIAFVAGSAIGAAAAWTYAKKYFNQIIEDTVKKCNACSEEEQPSISEPAHSEADDSTSDEDTEAESEKVQYHKAVKEYESEESRKDGPYVISPDEFRDGSMITAVTYSYFEDGVVTDEYDNIVEDVDEAIGEDFVNYFDEDVVYVRNEERNCDYEILREGFSYNDPPHSEEE